MTFVRFLFRFLFRFCFVSSSVFRVCVAHFLGVIVRFFVCFLFRFNVRLEIRFLQNVIGPYYERNLQFRLWEKFFFFNSIVCKFFLGKLRDMHK